jgi:hypothetical protein
VREFANFHESLVNPERTAHTGLSKGVDIWRASTTNQTTLAFSSFLSALKVRTDVTREDEIDFTHQEVLFLPFLIGNALKC